MMCEVISNIAFKNIIIYDNHAMNETHKSHVDSIYKQGCARHYSKGTIKNLSTENSVALPDARDQIAHIIIEESIH